MFAVEVMGMQYDENISKDIELKYISNIMEKKIIAWNRKERNKIKHQEVWMHTEGVHFRKVVMNLIDTTKQCKQQTLQMKTKITNALSIVLTAEHKRCVYECVLSLERKILINIYVLCDHIQELFKLAHVQMNKWIKGLNLGWRYKPSVYDKPDTCILNPVNIIITRVTGLST